MREGRKMRHLIRQSVLSEPSTLDEINLGDMEIAQLRAHFPNLTPAAVLLPLVERDTELYLILTQRTEHLHNHAGQICFPGGRVDAGDETPIATALRETEEEIGLSKELIEVVGYLDNYATATGFLISTVVGFVKPEFDLKLDSFEVADVFEVPLSFVLNPENHQRESRFFKGRQRSYYVINYQGKIIWGATAGILVNFSRRLQQA
jgi:8-oxo-dGTP pyrophosphatase MutT (NUDIX family)